MQIVPGAHYFRRNQAAAYLRTTYSLPCQPSLLAKLACIGGGPAFHKAGRTPIYTRIGLDEWGGRVWVRCVITRQSR